MEKCAWLFPKICNASQYQAYFELFYMCDLYDRFSVPKLTSMFSDANTSYTQTQKGNI